MRVLPGLAQKRVPQCMHARVRMRVDLLAPLRHLLFEHPVPTSSAREQLQGAMMNARS
jgi:hypothetical protein